MMNRAAVAIMVIGAVTAFLIAVGATCEDSAMRAISILATAFSAMCCGIVIGRIWERHRADRLGPTIPDPDQAEDPWKVFNEK